VDTTALQVSYLLSTLLQCDLFKQQKVLLIEVIAGSDGSHKPLNTIEASRTIILNVRSFLIIKVINSFLYVRFVTIHSLLDLLVNIVKLSGPLSGLNANLYIKKYNRLLREVHKHFRSEKNVNELSDCFIEQWNYINKKLNTREVERALMSPGILNNNFGNNGMCELLKTPATPKERAIESFRKFLLFKKLLPSILALTVDSEEELIQSEAIQEVGSLEKRTVNCFENEDNIRQERMLIIIYNELLITTRDNTILNTFTYNEVSIMNVSERIHLKSNNKNIELIFENIETAIEVYNLIITHKEKSKLKRIENYLKRSNITLNEK